MRRPIHGRDRHAWLLVIWVAALGAAPGFAAAAARSHPSVLLPRRAASAPETDALRRRLIAQRSNWPRFLTETHRNARLRSTGLLTQRSAAAAAAAPARSAAADTVRVLLVRVGFAANRAPGLVSMDPSGDFRLQPDSTAIVDPPPHDVAYFEAQLLGMRSYYDVMSFGQFVAAGTVFPPAGEASLRLSDPADFGPGPGGRWTLELLERYFRTTVALLDSAAAGRLDLRAYDSFMFMHPGSDIQNDYNGDSPNDLPSFFVTLADSVPVMGGSHFIRDGFVLPETLSQDGVLGGLLGTLCHEFGHQLGLPDWYDTYFGLPVVGEWDLMDSGNAAFFAFQEEGSEAIYTAFGLLPTGMCTLDRMLLGWDEPYVVHAPEEEVTLRPTLSVQGSGPRAVRLDVSPDEYFLVENRRDLLAERAGDVSACPYLNRDAETGVVLWMSRDDDARPPRERRNSGEYDYFIPSPTAPEGEIGSCGEVGFGLVVWHVDERVLADNYVYNEVNANEDMRALRIVEASGDYELGDWRQPTDGFLGDGWNDPFHEGYRTRLDATTVPNNWNSDWALTGWEIADVRFAPPESHTLVVRVADGLAGWPRPMRSLADSLPLPEPGSAIFAPVRGLGSVLIAADSSGISAYDSTGEHRLFRGALRPQSLAYIPQLVPGDSVGTLAALDTSGVWLWEARLVGDSLSVRAGFPMAIDPGRSHGGVGDRLVLFGADLTIPGGLAATQRDGWVRFNFTGGGGDFYASTLPPLIGPFAPGNPPGIAAFVSGTAVRFDCLCVESIPKPAAPPLPVTWPHGLDCPDSLLLTAGGPLDPSTNNAQVVLLRRDGALRVVDPERGVLPGFRDLPPDEYVGLALGDMNGDGAPDIIATSRTRVAVETSRGALLLESARPLRDLFAVKNPVQITAGPLVADVAGDSLPEILVSTDLGLVYALDAGGRPVAGFPRKLLPDRFPAALLATDVDGDGAADVVAVSALGAAAVSPAGGTGRVDWGAIQGSAAHHGFASAATPVHAGARLAAGERPFLAYPNPVRAGKVTLRITARREGPYALAIYNLEGQRVFEQSGTVPIGTKDFAWDCSGVAAGIYVCRFVCAAAGVDVPQVHPITVLR